MALGAGAVLIADQAAKAWLSWSLPLGSGRKLTPFLNLVHVRNPGAAFGLGSGALAAWLMIGLTLLGLAVLVLWALKAPPRSAWGRLGLGLALGGAAGNLVDRIRLQAVIDFLDFHWGRLHWPAFNLADAALTSGLILLVLTWIKPK